jgi:tetratricopeptide (TPR) repeat protein
MEGANKALQRLQKLNHFDDEKTFVQWLNAELVFSEGKISDSLPYYFNILNTRFREKALYQIARGYFFENKFREAITNSDILLLEFPNSIYAEECLFIKGEGLNKLRDFDHALDTYDLIVKQNKNNPWQLFALTQMGNIYLSRNEKNKAENAFKKILDHFPNDHPLFYNAALQLGNLNFKKNNITQAIYYYSMVLKGNILELFGEAHFSLGEIFYQQGKYEKAYTNFETAIGYLKETSLWFFLSQLEIGNLQRKWGKYEEAKKAYTIILDHSKDEEMKKAAKTLLNHLGSH